MTVTRIQPGAGVGTPESTEPRRQLGRAAPSCRE